MTVPEPNPDRVLAANVALHSSLAGVYNEREPHFRPENRAKVRAIVETLADEVGGGRLLDLGCGTGFIIDLAHDLFADVHGIDITPAMLGRVDRSRANVHLHEGRCEALPFETGSFSAVTAYSFLDHVFDPAAILREAARVLRPGGRMYVDLVPNRAFWGAIAEAGRDGCFPRSPAIGRELEALDHKQAEIEREFGLAPGTFALAEPSKNIGRGMDAGEVLEQARASGFRDARVEPHWFLGEALLLHGPEAGDVAVIDRYLRGSLPVTLPLFKYLRFHLTR